jgi:hypothetical protein
LRREPKSPVLSCHIFFRRLKRRLAPFDQYATDLPRYE